MFGIAHARQLLGQSRLLLDVRPDEAMSIIRASRLGALISIANSVIIVFCIWSPDQSIFLSIWLVGSVSLFTYIAHRSNIASKKQPRRISTRALKRLVILTSIFALPWSILVFFTFGTIEAQVSLLVLMMCAGMSAGGGLILYRIPIVAFGYLATILLSISATIIFRALDDLWPMIIFSITYGFVLGTTIIYAWQIARSKDESLVQAAEANKEVNRLALLDSLTGLLNRKAFIDILVERTSSLNNTGFAVFLLDLDRFKNINDSIGHGAGDELLQIVSERLTNAVSDSGIVARFGGDEFALIIDLENSDIDPCNIAKSLLNELNKPATIKRAVIHPNASIGIALYPDHTQSPTDFIKLADIALHHAKEGGRGRYELYSEEMRASLIRNDLLEALIRNALSNDRMQMHYQPKLDINTGLITGAEALLRCFDEQGNIVPTEEVLDVAEERGLIPQISEFTFRQVATDLLYWRSLNIPKTPISINVHAFELKTPEMLLEHLNGMFNAGVNTDDIMLEVTEGCFVGRGSDAATAILDMIDDMGVKLSLDDFGTGHAALSHLKRLPVSELKIDREFINGICHDHRDRAITLAALEITRCLNIDCVAEGIETKEQAKTLRELNKDGPAIICQGYYWYKPLTSTDFYKLLIKQKTPESEDSGAQTTLEVL